MQVGIDSFATAFTNDATTIELIGTRVAPILRAAEKIHRDFVIGYFCGDISRRAYKARSARSAGLPNHQTQNKK
jgi:hypothetical protein